MKQPLIQSLRFENLSYAWEGAPSLFDHIDFEFPMFQTVWIHAQGGHGRSSLLQLMAGLVQPTSGKYFINDQDITELTFEEFLPYRLKIGYGFDFGGLLNNRTLTENLMLPIMYHKMLPYRQAEQRVLEYLDFMGLTKYKDQRPAVVPGGVRKILCMLRAVILHPEVVLLDDPSVGMNEATVLKFFDLVRKIKEQSSLQHVFISSFDGRLVRLLGAKEVVINQNKLFLGEYESKQAANS